MKINADNFMVNGKPGTGHSPIERLLATIMSTWYLGSMAGVVWAHYAGMGIAKQAAIIGPFIYHFRSTAAALLSF